ncbi:MAG TPA: hypothetical protein DHV30_02310 [Balneola sp.]|nr:hypothetical protein [Balneola sp.]
MDLWTSGRFLTHIYQIFKIILLFQSSSLAIFDNKAVFPKFGNISNKLKKNVEEVILKLLYWRMLKSRMFFTIL